MGRAIFVTAILGALVSGCADDSARPAGEVAVPATAEVEPEQEPVGPTVLWVGGDVLPSGPFRRSMRRAGDPAAAFAEALAPTMQLVGDGFLLVNLEAPVAREVRVENDAYLHLKQGERLVRAPLNAPSWFLDGLAQAGVDGVMLANNHTLDQTRTGLGETIQSARAAGLAVTGAGESPHVAWPIVIGEMGARLSVLTYLERDYPEPELPPGTPGLNLLGPEATEHVRLARSEHDAVVVVVHVVYELRTRVKPRWRRWAADLATAGADAVLIHGQHVVGPIETIVTADGRRVVVAYGLGNFLSDMGGRARPGRDVPDDPDKWDLPQTREGLVARVELVNGQTETSFLPVFVSSTNYLVYNQALPAPPTFSLLPLSRCGPAADLPNAWPEPYRGELLTWIGERRDHLLSVTNLESIDCQPETPRPLRL
jgi:hypothetical protein